MTFQLDTSGVVYDNRHGEVAGRARTEWSDLSPFTQGYIEALFASLETRRAENLRPHVAERGARFSDLAPETLARIIADCEAFQNPTIGAADWVVFDLHTGRDFWNDRQGGQLTKVSARAFPSLTVTLGDDGKVRFQ